MNPARPSLAADTHLAQALKDIVQQHGRTIIDDPDRLTSALRDYSGGQGRGVFVLLAALSAGVPQRLNGTMRNVPPEVFRANLVRNLHTNHGIDLEQAMWAVDAWAVAMELPSVPIEFSANAGNAAIREAAQAWPDSGGRACPFCGASANAQQCGSCGRDTTAPRRICGTCKKMTPMADAQCWNCGAKHWSDLWWIIPLIVVISILAFVLSVIIQNS